MMEALARDAHSPEVETRRKAALALGETGREEALPLLDGLLGDPNWRVRKAAVESILLFPMEKTLPILFGALYDSDNAGKRNSASEALVKIGPPALPAIYDQLVENDLDVKLALITLLGEIPSRSSAPHLIYYLSHENKNILSAAITSLGQLRDTGSLPVLFDIFRREDDWLWFHLIDALSCIGGREATAKLMELYEVRKFRKAVLKSFGRLADLSVVPFLLERASEPGAPLGDLLECLGRIHHAPIPAPLLPRHQAELQRLVRNHFPLEMVEELDRSWGEAKTEERRGMIVVAGALGDLTLLDHVLDELENVYLQKDAYAAACAFGTAATQSVVQRLHRASTQEQRVLLIRLLGRTGGPESVVPLLGQAREEEDQIRMEALAALGQSDDPRALAELVSVLREGDPTFHQTALQGLKAMARRNPSLRGRIATLGGQMAESPEEGVRVAGYLLLAEGTGMETAPLLPGLRDSSPAVRRTVVRLVAERAGAGAFETLLPLLGDSDPKVRRAVVAALGRELLTRQSETLMALLTDADVWVRAEAAAHLAQSTDAEVGEALLKVLDQEALPVQLGALKGLMEVGCGALFPRVLELARRPDAPLEVRRAALAALARSHRPDAARLLTEALADPHWEIRQTAIELMGTSQDRRFLAPLLKELERDPDPLVKQAVIQALVSLKAVEAVPRMLNYLTDPVLKDAAFAFFVSLGRENLRLIEHEAQSVDFQTKLILIEILKHLEGL
ncbi:MAG: HEAT repeat domain-containing protein [Acidobacteriota bacterium]